MTTDDMLYALLVASLAVSCLLILTATVMVGKKLADRGYQKDTGINGTRKIQNSKELRTYTMRILVGVTFAGFAILLMADAPMIIRQWFNRSLFVLVPLGYEIATILDWLAERIQQQIEIEEDRAGRLTIREQAVADEAHRLETLQADHDAYREMAAEAVASLKVAAARAREERGEDPMPEMAAVVPEHSSPVTAEQEATAAKQTMRADLVASTKDLGLPPREAAPLPEPESSQIIVPESVDVVTIQPGAVKSIADAVADAMPEHRP